MSDATPEPFAAYHRAARRMTLARVIPTVIAAFAIATGLGYMAGAAPAAPSSVAVQESPAPHASPMPDAVDPTGMAARLPQPAAPAVAPPPVAAALPTLATTGQAEWSIAIDTTGYQAEIDKCLWVRMDLGVHAPIVGAHNYCGGDVVLGMAIGDAVTLAGVGLDGDYTVVAVRDARAGDNASAATDRLGGIVILQTCYWGNSGAERLVALDSR